MVIQNWNNETITVAKSAGGVLANRPHIVGYQCAGVVRTAGDGVVDRAPGQPVVAVMPNGSHAAMAAVPAASTWTSVRITFDVMS